MPRKTKQGIVVSDKMTKTIVVEVTRTKQHPLYKKFIRVKKRYMAHDEEQTAQLGDLVRIEESRPLSKNKKWLMTAVVREAPGHGAVTKNAATMQAHLTQLSGEADVTVAADGSVPGENNAPAGQG
jgi:small subunit ribosomal protein S17